MKGIIHQVCSEFDVSPEDLFEAKRGRENMLQLMVISIFRDLSKASSLAIARALPGIPVGRIEFARDRFEKYLQFVPGLTDKYERIKAKVIEKAGGF